MTRIVSGHAKANARDPARRSGTARSPGGFSGRLGHAPDQGSAGIPRRLEEVRGNVDDPAARAALRGAIEASASR